ncbi:MAG: hypothetical protein Q8P89_01645 [bacterium]|nr:hypothetical protein [bacterium]
MNKNINIFKTGMTAVEVVVEIVKQNPLINALAFYPYAPMWNVCEMPECTSFFRLLQHDSANGKEMWVKREKITADKLYKMTDGLKDGYVLSVLSKVVLNRNKTLHMPMMDFSRGPDELSYIVRFLKEAGYANGVILFSGRSFHYYGNYLMDDKEWRNFLGDCLLSGLADLRYIGHREKDNHGILRLSSCSLRPRVPKVVKVLDK